MLAVDLVELVDGVAELAGVHVAEAAIVKDAGRLIVSIGRERALDVLLAGRQECRAADNRGKGRNGRHALPGDSRSGPDGLHQSPACTGELHGKPHGQGHICFSRLFSANHATTPISGVIYVAQVYGESGEIIRQDGPRSGNLGAEGGNADAGLEIRMAALAANGHFDQAPRVAVAKQRLDGEDIEPVATAV